VTEIFQNSKKREGDNSSSENMACWFLQVFCSQSHSIAGKQEVGTGSGDMSLYNNSVVASRWDTDR